MRHTPVYIVCSPRPTVGKTMVARLVAEFLKLQRGSVIAFDVNLKEPSLIDYLPELTEAADISTTSGKVALMDRLIVNNDIAKVIDLGYHAYEEFFTMCEQIGYFAEALERGVVPVVLFLVDTDRGSQRAHASLLRELPEGALVDVVNDYALREPLPPGMGRGITLQLATLPVFLKSYIERLNFSFTTYLRSETDHSAELHKWVRAAYVALRDLDMRISAADTDGPAKAPP
jgi:hypothetical protein